MSNKDPIERVKRDNSNIYIVDRYLSDALKSTRFKKVKLYKFSEYIKVTSQLSTNPFEGLDFALDVTAFLKTLPILYEQVFFMFFIEGYSQEEIADKVGKTQGWVSGKVSELETLFNEFYYEED